MPMPKITSNVDNTTPERPGSISRKLLTPCRQIGLSRKRKTPKSTPTVPTTNQETNLKCDDTPLKHDNSAVTTSRVTRDSSEKSKSDSTAKTSNLRQEPSEPVVGESNIDIEKPDLQRKGRRSKRSNHIKTSRECDYLQQSNENSKTSRPTKSSKEPTSVEQVSKSSIEDNTKTKSDSSNKSSKHANDNSKTSKPNKSSKEPTSEEQVNKPSIEDNTKIKSDSSNKSSKSVSRRLPLNPDKIVEEPNGSKQPTNESVVVDPIRLSEPSATFKSDDGNNSSNVLDEISPPKKSKRFRRILSTKKTYSDDSIDVEDSPGKESVSTKVSNVTVELDRFDIDNMISQHGTSSHPEPLPPSDHLDDFTSSPAEDKWSVDDLTRHVTQLEDTVKTKKGHLNHLKQVQAYQKVHDIDDLKNLFATWKTGCIQALNDLLPHLASHSEIDMATLLKNLRIPPEFIGLSPQQSLV